MIPSFSRREFLKAGLAGSVLLACAGQAAADADEEADMLAAVAGALLAGMLPAAGQERTEAIAATVHGVRQAIGGLSASARKEVGELFVLLSLAPGRRFVAGLSSRWRDAGRDDVAAFLERWRFSRFLLLQGAYAALHDLVFGAWYAREESWAAIGYPGVPEVFA